LFDAARKRRVETGAAEEYKPPGTETLDSGGEGCVAAGEAPATAAAEDEEDEGKRTVVPAPATAMLAAIAAAAAVARAYNEVPAVSDAMLDTLWSAGGAEAVSSAAAAVDGAAAGAAPKLASEATEEARPPMEDVRRP
jgi:hypothetical protein